jgi:hypothetical protein
VRPHAKRDRPNAQNVHVDAGADTQSGARHSASCTSRPNRGTVP